MNVNHLLIGLCVEIITVIVVLHFLAKAKKDELGGGFKWAGRILLILGFLVIGCTLSRGLMGMMHRGECCQQEQSCPMMMHGGCCMHDGGCCNMQSGKCGMADGKCSDMKDSKSCKMDSANGKKCPMCKDHDMGKDKMHNDTTKGIK